MKKTNKQVKEKATTRSFYVDADFWVKIKTKAASRKISISNLIVNLLKEWEQR